MRSSAEARGALAGGCDILDVKEPLHGALGMPLPKVLEEIAALLAHQASPPPWSVALGELAEWPPHRPVPKLPSTIDFVKVGVAGLSREAVAERLPSLMARWSATLPSGATPPGWILATYADSDHAHAAAPHELFEVARQSGCAGLLIDTWSKQGPGLTGCLDEPTLQSLQAHARRLRLPLALAGRLQLADIPILRRVGPAIVGIRSAACVGGVRTGVLSAGAVARFRTALCAPAADSVFPPAPASGAATIPSVAMAGSVDVGHITVDHGTDGTALRLSPLTT